MKDLLINSAFYFRLKSKLHCWHYKIFLSPVSCHPRNFTETAMDLWNLACSTFSAYSYKGFVECVNKICFLNILLFTVNTTVQHYVDAQLTHINRNVSCKYPSPEVPKCIFTIFKWVVCNLWFADRIRQIIHWSQHIANRKNHCSTLTLIKE